MRTKIITACLIVLACGVWRVRAQQANAATEQRVGLEEQAIALDYTGSPALSAQLLTRALNGTPDAPIRNARFIIENRSASFYAYVSGTVTLYDEKGVRCGEGEFTLNALATGEQAETDAPGLRISCAPRSWRIVANNLLTRTSERAAPPPPSADTAQPATQTTQTSAPAVLPLEITVDNRVYNAPLGSTLEVPVGRRMVRITVRQGQ